MEITVIRLDDLTPNPRNIRKHSARQLQEYVRSVTMFGQIRPLVVDEDGVILAGNGLYEALIQKGAETAECYVYKGLTEKQKDKLMLADNKVYELGLTDMSVFDAIIKDLGDDLDVPGYDEDLLKLVNQSVLDATNSVMDYGNIEVSQNDVQRAEIERNDFGRTASQLQGQNPYKGIKGLEERVIEEDDDNDFEDEITSATTKKFIVCPKCGERIWL